MPQHSGFDSHFFVLLHMRRPRPSYHGYTFICMKPDKADMPVVCGSSAGQVFTAAVNKSGVNVEKAVEKVEKSAERGFPCRNGRAAL